MYNYTDDDAPHSLNCYSIALHVTYVFLLQNILGIFQYIYSTTSETTYVHDIRNHLYSRYQKPLMFMTSETTYIHDIRNHLCSPVSRTSLVGTSSVEEVGISIAGTSNDCK